MIDNINKKPLPNSMYKPFGWYFTPKEFERNGELYEELGVKTFKKGLMGAASSMASLTKKKPNHYFLQGNSLEDLVEFEDQTRSNEWPHALATLVGLSNIPLGIYQGSWLPIVAGLAISGISGYCVMLQRYNRNRIYSTIEKIKSKESEES